MLTFTFTVRVRVSQRALDERRLERFVETLDELNSVTVLQLSPPLTADQSRNLDVAIDANAEDDEQMTLVAAAAADAIEVLPGFGAAQITGFFNADGHPSLPSSDPQ